MATYASKLVSPNLSTIGLRLNISWLRVALIAHLGGQNFPMLVVNLHGDLQVAGRVGDL